MSGISIKLFMYRSFWNSLFTWCYTCWGWSSDDLVIIAGLHLCVHDTLRFREFSWAEIKQVLFSYACLEEFSVYSIIRELHLRIDCHRIYYLWSLTYWEHSRRHSLRHRPSLTWDAILSPFLSLALKPWNPLSLPAVSLKCLD